MWREDLRGMPGIVTPPLAGSTQQGGTDNIRTVEKTRSPWNGRHLRQLPPPLVGGMIPWVAPCSLRALRFRLSLGVGGADASRPIDGGPGSQNSCAVVSFAHIACNGNSQENDPVSCLLRRNLITPDLYWALDQHEEYPCGVKLYRAP